MPLFAVVALDVPGPMRTLGDHVRPPLSLTAAKNCASVFARPSRSPAPLPESLRQSCHVTARLPVVGSSASLGRNWLRVVESSLILTGALQLVPPLSEKRTKMSWLLLSAGDSSAYIK